MSPLRAFRRFALGTRAAAGLTAALLAVGTVAGGALVVDHVWLYDQRDVLKAASDAASVAATLELDRQLAKRARIGDRPLNKALERVARRYVLANLAHLPKERFRRAKNTLAMALSVDWVMRTVAVTASADLGGTLFSSALPLLGSYEGPDQVAVKAGVETHYPVIELVLAIDVSDTMSQSLRGTRGGATRLSVVKRAALGLVDILEGTRQAKSAVGIVPWHWSVRLDPEAAKTWAIEDWAQYPQGRLYHTPWTCNGCADADAVLDSLPTTVPEPWEGCLDSHRIAGGDARDPGSPTAANLFASPVAAEPFAKAYYPSAAGESYACVDPSTFPSFAWNSCYARNTTPPPRIQASCSARDPAMAPLSSDYDDARRAINAIQINRYDAVGRVTNSSLGVLWGQAMLEPAWKPVWGGGRHPVDPSLEANADVRKVVVLLTDGEDNHCDDVDCASAPEALARNEVCTAAKSRGTEIFVIAAMHPNNVSAGLARALRECSSESDAEHPAGTRRPDTDYVFLNNATDAALDAAFEDIANQLRIVRKIW